jgi:hypothetical protein
MAGAARPLEDLILEQIEYLSSLDGTVTAEEREELNKLQRQVARVKDPGLTSAVPADELPLGIAAVYWLDLRDYRPTETLQSLSIPVLILQGERDYQVTMEDFRLWEAALEGGDDVTFLSYPGLNHLFMTGEGAATPQEYFRPGNVDEQTVSDIARWLKSR